MFSPCPDCNNSVLKELAPNRYWCRECDTVFKIVTVGRNNVFTEEQGTLDRMRTWLKDPTGKKFEGSVHTRFDQLMSKFPDRVSFVYQPRIELAGNRCLIPDFELSVKHLHEKTVTLFECQNRRRNSVEVADKIRTLKQRSNRNRVYFLYPVDISLPLKNELENDGVVLLDFERFVRYVDQLDMEMMAIEIIEEIVDARRRQAAANQAARYETPTSGSRVPRGY